MPSTITYKPAFAQELALPPVDQGHPLNVSYLSTIVNPNIYSTKANDLFGIVVATMGNYTAIAATQEDAADGVSSGVVYVFDLTTDTLIHSIVNANAAGTSAYDGFGNAVAITNNYVIVGAPHEDVVGGSSGSVYVFSLVTGLLVQTLVNPNIFGTVSSDGFGAAVAASGNYIIVGTPHEDEVGNTESGVVYVFDATTWSLLHTIVNPNSYGTTANDWFGFSVACTSTQIFVGAPNEDNPSSSNTGVVYVFNLSTGLLEHTLPNPNPIGTHLIEFGKYITATEDFVCVGAPGETLTSPDGTVYVFDTATGTLAHTIDNPDTFVSTGDKFGSAVTCTSKYVIVGSHYEDEVGNVESGVVYVFDIVTGALLNTIHNPNTTNTSAYDQFGKALSCTTDYLVVGTSAEDEGGTQSGVAHKFSI